MKKNYKFFIPGKLYKINRGLFAQQTNNPNIKNIENFIKTILDHSIELSEIFTRTNVRPSSIILLLEYKFLENRRHLLKILYENKICYMQTTYSLFENDFTLLK